MLDQGGGGARKRNMRRMGKAHSESSPICGLHPAVNGDVVASRLRPVRVLDVFVSALQRIFDALDLALDLWRQFSAAASRANSSLANNSI